MEKYFVTYNQALALKELGYNKKCLAWYNWTGKELLFTNNQYADIDPTNAPLKQQVFEWFREKHNLISCVRTISYGCAIDEQEFYYEIVSVRGVESYEIYNKYEEAESDCIDKLIELVKSKKQ